MGQRFVFLAGCFLVITTVAVAGEKSPSQGVDLQGTWQVLSLEANGEKKPAEEVEGLKVIVKGDELWLVKPTGADPKLKYKLNPEKNTIDLTVQEGNDKGKVVLGIYALQEGQLRLCLNIFGDPLYRPSEFKTQERDGVAFATLERVKAK